MRVGFAVAEEFFGFLSSEVGYFFGFGLGFGADLFCLSFDFSEFLPESLRSSTSWIRVYMVSKDFLPTAGHLRKKVLNLCVVFRLSLPLDYSKHHTEYLINERKEWAPRIAELSLGVLDEDLHSSKESSRRVHVNLRVKECQKAVDVLTDYYRAREN
jgi:hypothetical protein